MFNTVKCRGHEDGKRFELKGGSLVSNVPLHPSGRKSFRKTDDETLEQFEQSVQQYVLGNTSQQVSRRCSPTRARC